MMYDVIIVGGGPAGFSAALYSARSNLKTLLIERFFAGGQMSTTEVMENYPGFEEPINGIELAVRMENQAKKFGTEVISEEVVELDLNDEIKIVKTTNGEYRCKTVILGMGGSPRKLGLPSENNLMGRGISYCATCDGSFYRDMDVAIIGGGDTAVEDANYLSRLCNKVYLVHRRDELRATKTLQDDVFKNHKVEIVWDSVPESINGDMSVKSINVKNKKTGDVRALEVSGIFVAIGSNPNTELIKDKLRMSQSGYIVTGEDMQTSIAGVFACGDIRDKLLRQVVTAAADGAIAAYAAEKYIGRN